MRNLFFFFLLISTASLGCAESDLEPPEETLRNQVGGRTPHDDTGSAPKDMGNTPDTASETDSGFADTSKPDTSTCTNLCTKDEKRCMGKNVEICVLNGECTEWNTQNCDQDKTCLDGVCTLVEKCIDNDNDGFGKNCPAGPDCNDNDNKINPNATESCDNIDNNCDSKIDEGFAIGGICTVGSGACQESGFMQCSQDGSKTECDAQPNTSVEKCDGVDNDCDGMIDENGVCAFCADDGNEPNNAIGMSTPITIAQPFWSAVCPGDIDYYSVTTQAGKKYRFTIQFPETMSDLKLQGFGNGNLLATSNGSGDSLGLTWTAAANTQYRFGVTNKDAKEGIYHVSFQDQADLACSKEDSFSPNHEISDAVTFLPQWRTRVYICSGTKDWYRLTGVKTGDSIFIEADGAGFFPVDLDIYLWGDPDGDLTFNVLARANGIETEEYIRFTATYDGTYYFNIQAPGDFGEYDIRYQH